MRPRIPLPAPRELRADVAELLSLTAPPGREPPGTMAVLARQPDLLSPFLGWAAALALNGALPKRDHELLALRVAWNCRSAFEWGEHVEYARAAGLDDGEVARVPGGAGAEGWAAHEAAPCGPPTNCTPAARSQTPRGTCSPRTTRCPRSSRSLSSSASTRCCRWWPTGSTWRRSPAPTRCRGESVDRLGAGAGHCSSRASPGSRRTRSPPAAAERRMASRTTMLATPSANVAGRGSGGIGEPEMRSRNVSARRV